MCGRWGVVELRSVCHENASKERSACRVKIDALIEDEVVAAALVCLTLQDQLNRHATIV